MCFLVTWLLISVVLLLAQCHLPRPWDIFGRTCIDLKAFWTVSLVVDVITQVIIAFLPTYLLRGLHISNKSNKWLVMIVFITNLIVIPLAVLRLHFLFRALDNSDFTWESFYFAIFTSFQPFVSIIFTAMPFLKPVLDSLVLQPYLIAVEEPQSIIPVYAKGVSWAQRILDSRTSRFRSQNYSDNSKTFGTQNESAVHWPYTRRQDDAIDLVNEEGLNTRTVASASRDRAMMNENELPRVELG